MAKQVDWEYVSSHLLSGDQKALNMVLEYTQQRAYSYAAVRKHADPDNFAQECSLKLWSMIDRKKLKHAQKLGGYISRIIGTKFIDDMRKKTKNNRDVSLDALTESYGDFLTAPSQVSLAAKLSFVEEHILPSLPPAQRVTIEMRLENMPFKTIVAGTDVSINTALGRVRYGKKTIQKSPALLRAYEHFVHDR